ncbi:SAM-dependent methyltransferase [Actinomadura hibisca]|uniref:SAM-dependent methyltransferase n=1 Tax=Actinomadura hibisca TaxID=68565 RepID=UPI00082C0D87|nr:SAM-dependent methyltransferase [Actinomadura hibisca]
MAEGRVRSGIDTLKASPARVYDYLLGGKDNFEADRALVDRLAAVLPDVRRAARANRAFVGRAVAEAAAAGVTQFLDLGAGLPVKENVHEIARRRRPAASVVYVDHDPMVVSHARALLQADEGVTVIEADLRRPGALLSDTELARRIDFDRPVAVLLAACLHFVPDEDDPAGIVAAFTRDLAPGSRLVISHWSGGPDPVADAAARNAYRRAATAPLVDRDPAWIRALFAGFDLLGPGLADVLDWRAVPSGGGAGSSFRLLAGVGRRPG